MALIKHSQSRSAVATAVILDLGDLARQGERLKEHARDQADEIVAQAHKERDRIIAGADEVGHQQGFERGFKEGASQGTEKGHAEAKEAAQTEFKAVAAQWVEAIDGFESARERMVLEAKRDIVAFAEVVARRVTKRVVELDGNVVVDQLDAVLRRVCKPSKLIIAINPADEATARECMPGLTEKLNHVSHTQLEVDETLGRGSCVVRTGDGGEIDASIETQIERVLSVLLPSGGNEPNA